MPSRAIGKDVKNCQQLCPLAYNVGLVNVKVVSTEVLTAKFLGGVFMKAITAKELAEKIEAGEDVQLIDVREPDENAFAKIDGAKLIPLGQVVARMSEIDPSRDTVVHCKGGVRSAKAIEALQAAGFQGDLTNLTGGITAWSNDVDPSVPKY